MMSRNKYSKAVLVVLFFVVYFVCSKLIFDQIYETSKVIIDEEFHLPLGAAYCKKQFDMWDPKVTTLPGMYIVSYLILSPLNLCTIYYLRFTNLVFHTINIWLSYAIMSHNDSRSFWKNLFSAFNIALLPPLYFFSHVYYTDVLSLTTVLLMILLSVRECHYFAALIGFCAVLMRQTNIIWVIFLGIRLVVTEIYLIALEHSPRRIIRTRFAIVEKDLVRLMRIFYYNKWILFTKSSLKFFLNMLCYGTIVIAFGIFVILNGSIVVGDKTAHEATIHIPQLFYFSLFVVFFSWPHLVAEIPTFLRYCRRRYRFNINVVALIAYIVYVNTLEHPYLLADNRHYVFYVWKRFYSTYGFRYAIIPGYVFGLYCILKTFRDQNDISYMFAYVPCLIMALIPQKLIEFRYFLLPYVLYRLNRRVPHYGVLVLEFTNHILINIITMYLFFTKEIEWEDFETKQRLIW